MGRGLSILFAFVLLPVTRTWAEENRNYLATMV